MENQDTTLTRQEPSLLEEITYASIGFIGGAITTGLILYNPVYAAAGVVAAAGVAGGVAAGVVAAAGVAGGVAAGVVNELYLYKKPKAFKKRLIRNLGISYLISTASVLGGNYLGRTMYSPQYARQFQTENHQGIVVESEKEKIPFVLQDDNYTPITIIQEKESKDYENRTKNEKDSLKNKHSDELGAILKKD